MALGDPVGVFATLDESATSFLVSTQLRHEGRRGAALAANENLSGSAMVFDSLGRALFCNDALLDLLAWESEANKLTGALEDRGRAFSSVAQQVGQAEKPLVPQSVSGTVLTSTGHYRLIPSVVGLDASPGSPFLAVVVVRLPLSDRGSHQLRTSARLTPRELEVAHLLCLGRNNAEIAKAICVSLSTTRRHVEHIFAKLGVHRRAEVLARLYHMTSALGIAVYGWGLDFSALLLPICY
jgi:DNA-binding CsgD family transcriptional regulator